MDHQTQLLRCVAIWQRPSHSWDSFISRIRELALVPEIDLPGTVWKQGKPAWIGKNEKSPKSPRASIALQEGFHGTFAFPFRLGTDILGMMEFFSREIMEPEEEFVNMFNALSLQMGILWDIIELKKHFASARNPNDSSSNPLPMRFWLSIKTARSPSVMRRDNMSWVIPMILV